jgi:hypothetical protein
MCKLGQAMCWLLKGPTGVGVTGPPLSVWESESTPTTHTGGNLSNCSSMSRPFTLLLRRWWLLLFDNQTVKRLPEAVRRMLTKACLETLEDRLRVPYAYDRDPKILVLSKSECWSLCKSLKEGTKWVAVGIIFLSTAFRSLMPWRQLTTY